MKTKRPIFPILALVLAWVLAVVILTQRSPVATDSADAPIGSPVGATSTGMMPSASVPASAGQQPGALRSQESAPTAASGTAPDPQGLYLHLESRLDTYPLQASSQTDRIDWLSERWASTQVVDAGRSPSDAMGVFRRVALVKAYDLPYTIRIEEMVHEAPSGEETVLYASQVVANHVVVRLQEGVSPSVIAKELEAQAVLEPLSRNLNIYRVVYHTTSLDGIVDQVNSMAIRQDWVRYAEMDTIVDRAIAPNDPSYLSGALWGLHNTGQDGGTANADIDAPEGWDIRREAPSIIVGVVDTGIHYTHEDLAANMWVNPNETANGIDDDGNGYVDDIHGINAIIDSGDPKDDGKHGTHVSGTIGARGNNGLGITGVAWNVKLMGLKFLGSVGGATSDAVKCIDYGVANGVHVLNNSWGGGGASQSLLDSIIAASDAGVIFVVAAGNATNNNDRSAVYPAAYNSPNIVTVAATDRNDAMSGFSNYGYGTVALGAPGSAILSAVATSDSSYESMNGTSMAAPHVAGVIALLLAEFPGESYGEIINRLYRGTDPIAALEGKTQTGGRLNLRKALTTLRNNPFNDDFSEASPIPDLNSPIYAKLFSPTAESSNISDGIADGASVWWKVTFASDGPGVIDLTGSSFDTLLGVYTGNSISNLVTVATDDDSGQGLTSRIDFEVASGVDYYIAVAGKNGEEGAISLMVGGPPENNDLANARDFGMSNAFGTEMFNFNTDKEVGERNHAGHAGGSSVWFKWKPPFARKMTVSTGGENSLGMGSDIDTLLAVYEGPATEPTHASLTLVAENDNIRGYSTSALTFDADPSKTYYIVIDGKNGAMGIVRLLGQRTPANDDFENARVVTGSVVNDSARMQGATVEEPFEPNHGGKTARHTLWWDWTPDESGDYVIDNIPPSGWSTSLLISVYTGDSLDNLTEIVSDTSFSAGSSSALVTLTATAGQSYKIVSGVHAGTVAPILGEVGLNIRKIVLPDNDDFVDANAFIGDPTPGNPITLTGTNVGATWEALEPSPPFSHVLTTNTVWWKWTPTVSGHYQMDTNGSTFDTIMELYTGPDLENLTRLGLDDDGGDGRASYIDWNANAGTTYYFRIVGYSNRNGDITMNLATYTPQAHDSFADAKVINPDILYLKMENSQARIEPGEPKHGNREAANENSMWFTFTPDSSNAGMVVFSSQGSSQTSGIYGTHSIVAVYTGNAINALTQVAVSTEYANRPNGQVQWNAVAGTTYHIVVTRDEGSPEFAYYVSFLPLAPNNDFANAQALSGDVVSVESHNFGANKESGEPNHGGNSGGRSVWFDWTPDTTGFYKIDTEGSYFRFYWWFSPVLPMDTTLAVYTGANVNALNLVKQNNDRLNVNKDATTRPTGVSSQVFMQATAGETYRIAVDGHNIDGADWGSIKLNIAPFAVESHTLLVNALEVTETPYQYHGSNMGTSQESGEPNHAGNATRSAHSMWWKFVPDKTQTYFVSTAGNVYDRAKAVNSVVAVYSSVVSDPGFGDLTPVASHATGDSLFPSVASFTGTAGQTYYIAASSQYMGSLSVLIAPRPVNDDILNATVMHHNSFKSVGYNVGSTGESGERSSHGEQNARLDNNLRTDSSWRSVWYRWTARSSGTVDVNLLDSELWMHAAAYDITHTTITSAASVTGTPLYDNGNASEGDPHNGANPRNSATKSFDFQAQAGHTYLFRISGAGSLTDHLGTYTLEVTGQPAPPPVPADFHIERINSSRVDLTWRDLSDDENLYQIERSEDNFSWTLVQSTEANVEAFSDLAAPSGDVYYRIRAGNNVGFSAWVTLNIIAPSAPAAPHSFSAVATSPHSVDLSWTPAVNANVHTIQRSSNGAGGPWVTLASGLDGSVGNYSDVGLDAGTNYDYSIRSFNEIGASGWAMDNATTDAADEYTITLPAEISETAGSFTATVSRTGSSGNQVVFLSTDDDRLSVPDSVVIADGQSSIDFTVTVIDDAIINPSDIGSITAFAPSALVGESFTGAVATDLAGQNTGWGWGGAWIGVNASPVLVEPSLTYNKNGTIATPGTRAARLSNAGSGGQAYRALSEGYTSGSVWVSTLLYRNSTNWGTQFIVRNNPGSGAWGRVRYENSTNHWILEASGATAAVPNENPVQPLLDSNPYPTTFFLVMEFDFTARKIRAWMNPDVSGGSPANAIAIGEVDMQSTMSAVNRLDILGHSNLDQFDEIRVANSFADLHGGTTTTRAIRIHDDESAPPLLTAHAQWRKDNFGATAPTGHADPNGDADGDGISNLLEYALGGDPWIPDTAILPEMGSTFVGDDEYLTLSVAKNPDASDIAFTVVTSTDLVAWYHGAGYTVVLSETSADLLVRTHEKISDHSRMFLRVEIVEKQP